MLQKGEIVSKIKKNGLVAVVRADNPEQAIKISKACIDGGVKAIEITFTVPNAEEAILTLSNEYKGTDIIIGAGTVLNCETAEKAIESGAQFVVSPYLNQSVAKLCIDKDISYMPGAMTLTETANCIEAGADIVKIFPGELFGPAIIKAFRGPMPKLQLMPTGGVSLDNVHEWVNAGVVAVGVGSNLTSGAKIGDYESITRIASQFVERINQARANKGVK
jgi:2-dehydro-3-deoxyphosphogluconate aldolase/(4S)-4-hydroxy-2-oxoglutarate aldolase